MQKLEQRIATLEQAIPKSEAVSHIFLVPLGRPDSIQTISRNGDTWQRLESETAKEFQERVAKATPITNCHGPLRLFTCG